MGRSRIILLVHSGDSGTTELALRIPQRIGSLVLAVTTPGGGVWNNLPPWKGVNSLARLTITMDPVQAAPTVLAMLFPEEWLAAQSEEAPGKTNRELQTEVGGSYDQFKQS